MARWNLTPEQRFWNAVDKKGTSDCWLWKAGRLGTGYGAFRGFGENKAHRFSWVLHNGPIPTGLHVCHYCDVPLCVNPTHLFVGTDADNMRDMVSKGRAKRGEHHVQSKLTNDQVAWIRDPENKQSGRSLSLDLGCSRSLVTAIRRGGRRKRG